MKLFELPFSCSEASARIPCRTELFRSDGSDKATLEMNCARMPSSVGPSTSDFDSLTWRLAGLFGVVEVAAYRSPAVETRPD